MTSKGNSGHGPAARGEIGGSGATRRWMRASVLAVGAAALLAGAPQAGATLITFPSGPYQGGTVGLVTATDNNSAFTNRFVGANSNALAISPNGFAEAQQINSFSSTAASASISSEFGGTVSQGGKQNDYFYDATFSLTAAASYSIGGGFSLIGAVEDDLVEEVSLVRIGTGDVFHDRDFFDGVSGSFAVGAGADNDGGGTLTGDLTGELDPGQYQFRYHVRFTETGFEQGNQASITNSRYTLTLNALPPDPPPPPPGVSEPPAALLQAAGLVGLLASRRRR